MAPCSNERLVTAPCDHARSTSPLLQEFPQICRFMCCEIINETQKHPGYQAPCPEEKSCLSASLLVSSSFTDAKQKCDLMPSLQAPSKHGCS